MNDTDEQLPWVYLARHGETAWNVTGQHTGLTDLPLTERGKRNARRLGERLKGLTFARVFSSPLQRASQTCELAGFGAVAEVDDDLAEWNYGAYEGKTTERIWERRPGWEIFRDGCPDGESAADVAVRADRVIDRIRAIDANVLLVSHGHYLDIFAARWLGLEPVAGRCFFLGTAALSIVAYHHRRDNPIIRRWNDCSHSGD